MLEDGSTNLFSFYRRKPVEKGHFYWPSIEVRKEHFPGRLNDRPYHRHYAMKDAELLVTPFISVPSELFVMREHVRGGYLSGFSVAFSRSDDDFYGVFLPWFQRDVRNHHQFSAETVSQRSCRYRSFHIEGGDGKLRSYLPKMANFTSWADPICDRHEDVLLQLSLLAAYCGERNESSFLQRGDYPAEVETSSRV